MSIAVCPGSFDPVTLGHQYVFGRAATRFDELVIAVLDNPRKQGLFTVPERVEMIGEVTADLPNVRVLAFTGLLVDLCRDQGIDTIVKGLRSSVDFEYEIPMAQMNRDLTDVETMFLLTDPPFAHVSSSLVKEVAKLGGDIAPFVAPSVLTRLHEKLEET